MTDNNSSKGLEDWEVTPEAQHEAEVKERTDLEKYRDDMDRNKHLCPGWMWFVPWPHDARALIWCHNSGHLVPGGDWYQYYWIAVRKTTDDKAYELVRIETDDNIVEQYPGRYLELDHALFAANTLSKNWEQPVHDAQASAMSEERDLSRNLKLNPWGRAVWERKDPDGPVLVVWQLEPLPLFVAGWLPFAGSRCIPSLAQFVCEADPARVSAVVDALGEEAYNAGPSDKMIARAKSIAASYAANGRKGGRPKKKQKDGQVEG
jgi:hypothetical protein